MNPSGQSGEARSRMSSTRGSGSLRPRPKRLISGLDDAPVEEEGNAASEYTTIFDSPFDSRTASPIPSKHPSRSSSINPAWRKQQLSPSETWQYGNDLTASFSDIWGKSWTSLQSIASNVLGSDASAETLKDKGPQRRRRPFEATHARNDMSPGKWGPSSSSKNQPGAGSLEERKAVVRAMKREELLAGNGNLYPSALYSRYKRRTSDEFESTSAPPGEQDDRDALVYIHHVTAQDTLPGISIKFNCDVAMLKKANRMWSNDSIQTRKIVMLPVDECGVKGRPVPGPSEPAKDLLNEDEPPKDDVKSTRPSLNQRGSSATIRPGDATSGADATSTTASKAPNTPSLDPTNPENVWKHDSWVLLDGQQSAIEIARLPRRELGFFPRARRPSLSMSDIDTPSANSFDLPSRPSFTISDTGESRSASQTQPNRHRRSSSSHHFAHQMVGPGGVGTLGGKGPSAPGPAEDKFTRAVSKHFPGIMPPPPPPSDPLHPLGSTPTSTSALSGTAGLTGIENLGGALEGWFRKVAANASKAIDARPNGATFLSATDAVSRGPATSHAFAQQRSSRQSRHRATGGRIEGTASGGDLIELSDAFEIGDEQPDPDDNDDDDDAELTRRLEDDTRRGRRPPPSQRHGQGL